MTLFLTAREMGEELGLKKSRVYELAHSGTLPVVRFGSSLLFPKDGLGALAEDAIARALRNQAAR